MFNFVRLQRSRRAFALATGICWLSCHGSVMAGNACLSTRMLVSGYTSDNIHVYDSCDGTYLFDLDSSGTLNGVQASTVGPDGSLYVVSEENDRVVRFDGDTGALIDNFVWNDPMTPGDDTGGLDAPTGLTFGPDGNLYVCGFNSDNVIRYDGTTGNFIDVFVTAGSAGLNGPDAGMMFGPDGNLYIPGWFSNRVHRYDGTTGASTGTFISSIGRPRTLVFREGTGTLLVTSWLNNRVEEFNAASGAFVSIFSSLGTNARPTGMAYGPDGNIYVASDNLNQVWQLDAASGAILDVIVPGGSGGLAGATYVSFWSPSLPVPAASTWGLVVLLLTLLIGGTFVFRYRVVLS